MKTLKKGKLLKNIMGITKLPTAHLKIVQDWQMWYQMNAKGIPHFMPWLDMQILFMIMFLNINLYVKIERKMVIKLKNYSIVATTTLGTNLKLRHFTSPTLSLICRRKGNLSSKQSVVRCECVVIKTTGSIWTGLRDWLNSMTYI